MSTTLDYFNAERVRKVLSWPLVNEAVEAAFKAVSNSWQQQTPATASVANQPPRSLTVCNDRSQILFAMPGYVGNYQLSAPTGCQQKYSSLACKLVTSFSKNAQREPPLPNILGNILLFNTETGQLQCIIDGTDITAWRTAAASIVATKYLYMRRFADWAERCIKVAIIGTGVQGQSHALGMCASFNVSEVQLWNRTSAKAQALAAKLRVAAPQTQVHVANSAAEAVADADVICVGTYAAHALVTADMLKKCSVHINTVGAGEVHFGEVGQDVYDLAKVYVDSMANAKVELKDLKVDSLTEVGEVINSGAQPPPEGITIFQSMGMASEDVTVAQAVYEVLKAN